VPKPHRPIMPGRQRDRGLPAFRFLGTGTTVAVPGHGKGLSLLTMVAALLAGKATGWLVYLAWHGFDAAILPWTGAALLALALSLALAMRFGKVMAATYVESLRLELAARGVEAAPLHASLLALARSEIASRQLRLAMLTLAGLAFASVVFTVLTPADIFLLSQTAGAMIVGVALALIGLRRPRVQEPDTQYEALMSELAGALGQPKAIADRL
jgi:hypothetical protein